MKTKDASGGFCFFKTTVGLCSISWTDKGIDSVQLPLGSDDSTMENVRLKAKDRKEYRRPPADLADATKKIADYLAGGKVDLAKIKLDLGGLPKFNTDIYKALRKVKPGSVVTYGTLGMIIGKPQSARAVGRAMATNPLPLLVPCHRVIAANGKLGGFSAHDGIATKIRLLEMEGVDVVNGKVRAAKKGDTK